MGGYWRSFGDLGGCRASIGVNMLTLVETTRIQEHDLWICFARFFEDSGATLLSMQIMFFNMVTLHVHYVHISIYLLQYLYIYILIFMDILLIYLYCICIHIYIPQCRYSYISLHVHFFEVHIISHACIFLCFQNTFINIF